jgi:hypothetical protein
MLLRLTLLRTVRTLLIAAVVVVYLAPLRAQDTTATVIAQTGRVSVMTDSRGELALSKGMAIKPQQVIVTGPDGYAVFEVSDGSTFEVFNDARVVFRPKLANWKDLLDIVLGRVKVYIQHPPGKVNHNEVSSPTAVISVRGTIFDVNVEDVDGTTLVTVEEGLVESATGCGKAGQRRHDPGWLETGSRYVLADLERPTGRRRSQRTGRGSRRCARRQRQGRHRYAWRSYHCSRRSYHAAGRTLDFIFPLHVVSGDPHHRDRLLLQKLPAIGGRLSVNPLCRLSRKDRLYLRFLFGAPSLPAPGEPALPRDRLGGWFTIRY